MLCRRAPAVLNRIILLVFGVPAGSRVMLAYGTPRLSVGSLYPRLRLARSDRSVDLSGTQLLPQVPNPWAGARGRQSVAYAGMGLRIFHGAPVPVLSLCRGFINRLLGFSPPPSPCTTGLDGHTFREPGQTSSRRAHPSPSPSTSAALAIPGQWHVGTTCKRWITLREGDAGSGTREHRCTESGAPPRPP